MRKRAEKAGYPGRAFPSWARGVLLGKDPAAPRPRKGGEKLSVAQAAEHAGVSRQQVYLWIKRGKLEVYDLPEGMRLDKTDLETFRKKE